MVIKLDLSGIARSIVNVLDLLNHLSRMAYLRSDWTVRPTIVSETIWCFFGLRSTRAVFHEELLCGFVEIVLDRAGEHVAVLCMVGCGQGCHISEEGSSEHNASTLSGRVPNWEEISGAWSARLWKEHRPCGLGGMGTSEKVVRTLFCLDCQVGQLNPWVRNSLC